MLKDLVVVCYFPLLDVLKPYWVSVVSGFLERAKRLFCLMTSNKILIALDSQRQVCLQQP